MPILLDLFITFFLIGLFSFGGGYGMVSLLRSIVIDKGWLSAAEVSDMVAVSEATPGPLSVNMATYVGSIKGGFFGSLLATIAVVLPAFIIIVLVYKFLNKFRTNRYVSAFLTAAQPVIVALILSTGLIMMAECFYVNFKDFSAKPQIDFKALIFISALIVTEIIYKIIKKKNISPIILIVLSAIAGILVF